MLKSGGTMRWPFTIFLLAPLLAHAAVLDVPDATVTPGATNAAVTQATIMQTICVPNWTNTVRPPASYTTKLKLRQLADGPYKSNLPASAFEEDHFLSIELGGHPTDERNLWPQHYSKPYGAREKDAVENWLHRRVCWGGMPLAVAQQLVLADWIAVYISIYGEMK